MRFHHANYLMTSTNSLFEYLHFSFDETKQRRWILTFGIDHFISPVVLQRDMIYEILTLFISKWCPKIREDFGYNRVIYIFSLYNHVSVVYRD